MFDRTIVTDFTYIESGKNFKIIFIRPQWSVSAISVLLMIFAHCWLGVSYLRILLKWVFLVSDVNYKFEHCRNYFVLTSTRITLRNKTVPSFMYQKY